MSFIIYLYIVIEDDTSRYLSFSILEYCQWITIAWKLKLGDIGNFEFIGWLIFWIRTSKVHITVIHLFFYCCLFKLLLQIYQQWWWPTLSGTWSWMLCPHKCPSPKSIIQAYFLNFTKRDHATDLVTNKFEDITHQSRNTKLSFFQPLGLMNPSMLIFDKW